jgi:hypothetical protein
MMDDVSNPTTLVVPRPTSICLLLQLLFSPDANNPNLHPLTRNQNEFTEYEYSYSEQVRDTSNGA